jgi:hypothetical protein
LPRRQSPVDPRLIPLLRVGVPLELLARVILPMSRY